MSISFYLSAFCTLFFIQFRSFFSILFHLSHKSYFLQFRGTVNTAIVEQDIGAERAPGTMPSNFLIDTRPLHSFLQAFVGCRGGGRRDIKSSAFPQAHSGLNAVSFRLILPDLPVLVKNSYSCNVIGGIE